MRRFVILLILQSDLLSAQRFKEEEAVPFGMPQERLFQHPDGVPLGQGSKQNKKFKEEKVFPVEYFNPPNRNVEEMFYNKKAELNQNEALFKIKGFTDTDLIMMNRWKGMEKKEGLWEADMLLTEQQKNLYSHHGKIYENEHGLMPNFSLPWPVGKIQYFHENEGTVALFNDLQKAMHIWEAALGCIRFEIPDNMQNFASVPNVTEAPSSSDEDYYDYVNSKETVTSAPNASAVPVSDRFEGTSDFLRVTVDEGCYCTVGYQPWSRLVISEHCSLGVLVHLLGHVLGLPHEHSRPDRHLHIRLHPEQIESRDFMFLNVENGGKKCTSESSAGWYDVHSVMHLDPFGLSVSNFSSMSSRHFSRTAYMGATWTKPSYNDVLRLRQPGAYDCPPLIPQGCPYPEQPCLGRMNPECKCERAAQCISKRSAIRGGCSASVKIGHPHVGSATGAEQMSLLYSPRARSCAWALRARNNCERIRLTLSVKMEEEARVTAAALGCEPLRVETHDNDTQDNNSRLSGVVCLGDFARWKPTEHDGSWHAQKVIVSTSPQLHVLFKSYPAGANTALGRVIASLTARAERAVDKACHCKLDLY